MLAQARHRHSSGVPHSPQNFFPSGAVVPHCRQSICVTPTRPGARTIAWHRLTPDHGYGLDATARYSKRDGIISLHEHTSLTGASQRNINSLLTCPHAVPRCDREGNSYERDREIHHRYVQGRKLCGRWLNRPDRRDPGPERRTDRRNEGQSGHPGQRRAHQRLITDVPRRGPRPRITD